ncbi:transglutaminase domain-containing protein [Candidatus Woesearchaeota archaeon]|nr:transglutaminase domain-containing protein [Candidatus Woesearchaeota archaeon]
MRKIVLSMVVLSVMLLVMPFVLAQGDNNLYRYDSLKLNLDVRGSFDLTAENSAAKIKDVKAQLLLYPKDDYRQKVLAIDYKGELNDNKIVFYWNDMLIEKKTFGYLATLNTNEERVKVSTKVPFPLTNIKGYEAYTLPTETIDSGNEKIIAKATELAEGEDDEFKVAFKLASWVESNVKYDLNTLTAQSSQKASWVLDNKEGVCDEMTSLFVAMSRSLGIPARFVSGISYTTSDLFTDNWQPHGWAEVYFPEIGWVSFDIAFGEFGYIDSTHIKLRDGFDPSEPATKYEWLAEKVRLEAKPLSFNIDVLDKGKYGEEEILLEVELLSKEVGFGSYNLVKGIIKNSVNNYNAVTLQLALPTEIEVLGRNRRTLLLGPKEVKETYWLVKVPELLSTQYVYQFPMMIYSEKNISAEESFTVQNGKSVYSKEEIEKLMVQDEDKSYSRKVQMDCDYKPELSVNEEAVVKCAIKNNGNTLLKEVNFCVDKICEIVELGVNQQKNTEIKVKGETIGWNKIIVSAMNIEVEKKKVLEYRVMDLPKVEFKIESPAVVQYGEVVPIKVVLNKKSFSVPNNIVVFIEGANFQQKWELDKLVKEEKLELQLENVPLSSENKFKVIVKWKDDQGREDSESEDMVIRAEANSFSDNIKMFLNGIMGYFT